ncbi:MAG: serine dehydrogenasease [Bacteroidales bacterium]|jgi:ClpP class serine protease|nr:serine dehydrogenasease [Bacteroidales bacterium]
MEYPINDTIKSLLNKELTDLEEYLNADVLTYYGPIVDGTEGAFLQIVEQLCQEKIHNILFVLLTTSGGSATAVERHVNIIRHHYSTVNFIIPDKAFSAGTIFCMSGDNIYMDYYSVLGPIDPQIQNKEGKWVPALGYLDKINELIQKAQNNTLTQAEFIILKEFDLAELRAYEQAKELTIDLLKKWLVVYKFKKWTHHRNREEVTQEEKIKRAEEIADKLSNNRIWKSHSRPLNIEALEKLKLKINDFGKDSTLKNSIRAYHRLATDFVNKNQLNIFVHTRSFI